MDDVEVTRPVEGVTVVALHGEHDALTEEALGALLGSLVDESALLVVDVSDADFVDSSFLCNLTKADRSARARGSRFVLQLGTAPIVRRALELSGLLEHLEWVGTLEEALTRSPSPGGDPP